jgi:signal transduction histidine kinase
MSARVNAEVRTQAQGQADLVAATAADLLGPTQRAALQALARQAAISVRGRVLIVDSDGTVLADSGVPAALGSSYESRPEITAALKGRQVQVQRASKTLGEEILATAVPIIRNRRTVGAVRVTESVAAVNSAVRRSELGIALIALVVLALGLSAGALIAATVARPLKRLEGVARRVAHGDLSARAHLEGSREQRSLARSFNEMTARIARLLTAQRDFVADASHQLRTPLTGLRLRLEEARALDADSAAAADLDAAIAEVDRLSHTVDELLELSNAGERRLAGAAVALDEVARAAVDRWRPAAAERAIGLMYRGPGGGRVWASRQDLERALDALIENALHYAPRATTVEVVSSLGTVEVRDRGPGVGEDERQLVFERFRRGRAGRAGPPGSGLGLPIARELAREWSGDVVLMERDGGGAVAALVVPELDESSDAPLGDRFARA